MTQNKKKLNGKIGGASWSRVSYQRGLPRLVLVKVSQIQILHVRKVSVYYVPGSWQDVYCPRDHQDRSDYS